MSRHLPTWLAEWLGVPPTSGGEAVTWQFDSAWHWAPWATVLFILAAIAWTVLIYSRESSTTGRRSRALLTALRLAAIAMLLIMLAQWAITVRLTGPPTVAVIMDRSASMGIVDTYADSELAARLNERLRTNNLSEASRINLAKLLLTENDGHLPQELAERYRLEVFYAAGGVERQSLATDTPKLLQSVRDLRSDGPDSDSTRLGDALRHVLEDLRGTPPAGIILLTDGVTTTGLPLADAAQEARRKRVPLFAIGLGNDQPPRDIELTDVLVDDVVFVNDLVSFQVQIKASGLEGQAAKVVLHRDGQDEPLAQESIVLPPGGETLSLRLVDRPTTPGDVAYIVEVIPLEGETNPDNNRQRRVVSVRDEQIRVLLVQAYPSFEFRFLKTLLERDSTIKLSTYLQDADPEYAEQDKTALRAFPTERNELFEYDVIVIGDVDPRPLPRNVWQNIRAFVTEKGGGLAMLAGPRFMPWLYRDNPDIAALLPVSLDHLEAFADAPLAADITRGFVVRPTPLGLQNAAFQLGSSLAETEQIWRNLAPLYWLAQFGDLKPAAQVLAEHPTHTGASGRNLPVICFQFVGAGRVLLQAIDSTWRWRTGVGEAFFARYWVQTIRYLARGKLTGGRGVQLSADRREYHRGEPVRLRVRFFDERLAPAGGQVTVVVEAASQPRQRVQLQRNPAAHDVFEGSLPDLVEGQYQVLLIEPQLPGEPPATQFAIASPQGEMSRPEMDGKALATGAELTRGKYYTIADADRLLEDLPTGRRVPIENLPPVTIWNQWWLLAAFLTCVTTEWILRKRLGML